jgi:hypothetical protein
MARVYFHRVLALDSYYYVPHYYIYFILLLTNFKAMVKQGDLVQKIHSSASLIHSIGRIKTLLPDGGVIVTSLSKNKTSDSSKTWDAGSFKLLTNNEYRALCQTQKKKQSKKKDVFAKKFAKALQHKSPPPSSPSKKRRRLHSPTSAASSPRYRPPAHKTSLPPRLPVPVYTPEQLVKIQEQKAIIQTYRGKHQPPMNRSTLKKKSLPDVDIVTAITHPVASSARICMVKAHSAIDNHPRFMEVPEGVQIITLTQLCDNFPLEKTVDDEFVTFMVDQKQKLFESDNPYQLTSNGKYLQNTLQEKVDETITIRNHIAQDVVANHRVSFRGAGCESDFGCGVQEYDLDAPDGDRLVVDNKMDKKDVMLSDIIEQFGQGVYVCVFCRSCEGVNDTHLKLYRQLSGMK